MKDGSVVPIGSHLAVDPLHSIITKTFFPEDDAIEDKQVNLLAALESYVAREQAVRAKRGANDRREERNDEQ